MGKIETEDRDNKKELRENACLDIEGGWVVEIEGDDENYEITGIHVRIEHGVYLPIDTQDFSDEQWKMFHDRIETVLGDNAPSRGKSNYVNKK